MADLHEGLITVFRSADPDAAEQAARAAERLDAEGIAADVFDDGQPGVVVGTCEVRVDASLAASAESILAVPPAAAAGDASHTLDLVPVFHSQNFGGEMEALAIRSILDASGVPSVLMGNSQIPSLPFEVHVPRAMEEAANRAIAEARAAGPEAAEEAEAAEAN